jgi:hypothetical protein
MNVVTYEGVVENGHVQLPPDAVLPEKATVYVVVPAMKAQQTVHFRSPRLADPAQAARFEMEVGQEGEEGSYGDDVHE